MEQNDFGDDADINENTDFKRLLHVDYNCNTKVLP